MSNFYPKAGVPQIPKHIPWSHIHLDRTVNLNSQRILLIGYTSKEHFALCFHGPLHHGAADCLWAYVWPLRAVRARSITTCHRPRSLLCALQGGKIRPQAVPSPQTHAWLYAMPRKPCRKVRHCPEMTTLANYACSVHHLTPLDDFLMKLTLTIRLTAYNTFKF